MIMNTSPIQMEWFLNLEGHKTKFNWFLLEFALEYYDHIRRSPALGPYREQYDVQQIAQYCAYYAKRMKKSLLNNLRGRTKHIIFYEEYISDFYPHHEDELNGVLNSAAMEAFEELQPGCRACTQMCLRDYRGISPFFDEYKD